MKTNTSDKTHTNGATAPLPPANTTESGDASEGHVTSATAPPPEVATPTASSDVDEVLMEAGVIPSASPSNAGPTGSTQDAHREGSSEVPQSPLPTAEPSKPASKKRGPTTERIKLIDIKRDDRLCMRDHLHEDAITDYTEKYVRERDGTMEEGEKRFPYGDVFRTPDGNWYLVNGWHRDAGMRSAGIVEWDFLVYEGTFEDAIIFAAKANDSNSAVRVSNKDKQRICKNLGAAFATLTSREIAKKAGVDAKTVEKWRPADSKGQPRTDANGVTRKMPKRGKDRKNGKANGKPKGTAAPENTQRPVAANTNGVNEQPEAAVPPNTSSTTPVESPPSSSAKPPVQPPAVSEPEEPDTVPTQTVTSRGVSVSLALVSARGHTNVIVASSDQKGNDAIVALITRAQSLGLDLTKPKSGTVLRLLELGLDEHEREMAGQKRLVHLAEELADAEAAAARSGGESVGTQQ